jgi:nucleotide-binding universal stress UspA family protein
MSFPKTILFATDFQEISEKALAKTVALAKATKAKVILVHAYQIPVFGFMDGAYVPTPADLEKILGAAGKALDAARARVAAEGVEVDAVLRNGNAAEVVVEVRKERGCDLVVVGSHGRGLLGRALLGSVTQNVLRVVDVPVMVVRGAEDGER